MLKNPLSTGRGIRTWQGQRKATCLFYKLAVRTPNFHIPMDDKEVGQYWNDNALVWTMLARAGFDIYRDHLNTPAFFEILPNIQNLAGLDIGCGEGHNTRLLAQKGAYLTAIDIAENFIQKAKETEEDHPLNIEYRVASATHLPFENEQFDFATSFMCLMDLPHPDKALQEAYRVLKPNGFLQFSITHPCFMPAYRKLLKNKDHKAYAVEVGDYFKRVEGRIDEWIFTATPTHLKTQLPQFKVPIFCHTLTEWFTAILNTGFIIEQINEPYASDEIIAKQPALQDTQIIAYFLHIRCRKPSGKNFSN
jgi:ubiquinone/menaquinone biosynthesis C-methylase UbiE